MKKKRILGSTVVSIERLFSGGPSGGLSIFHTRANFPGSLFYGGLSLRSVSSGGPIFERACFRV